MFRLRAEEKEEVVANCDHLSTIKFSAALPNAFTGHGAIMVASIINSPRAIGASIFVVRAFVRLRKTVEIHTKLLQMFRELERRIVDHDEQIEAIFEAIHQLMASPEKPRRKIGFEVKEKRARYGYDVPKPKIATKGHKKI